MFVLFQFRLSRVRLSPGIYVYTNVYVYIYIYIHHISHDTAMATRECTPFKVVKLILYQFIDREQKATLRELLHY